MSGPAEKAVSNIKLPHDIYSALVATLFGTVGSFLSGLVGGLLFAAVAWYRTDDPIFLAALAVVTGWSLFRLAVLLAYRRATPERKVAEAERWSLLYGIGGVGFMTSVGITAAILFAQHRDEVSALYAFVITLGCAGALAGRNAGRPIIVFGQVIGVCGPPLITLLFVLDPWYWGLAGILFLVMTSVKSTTKFLNGVLTAALLNEHEARLQRARFGAALDSMTHGLCMGDQDGAITVINRRLRELFRLGAIEDTIGSSDLAGRIADSGGMGELDKAAFLAKFEMHVARRDSSIFSASISTRIFDFRCEPMENGGFVIVVEDVTEARIASREIERMAHFDTLTGLPNRILFHNRLMARFLQDKAHRDPLCLLSIDLDQFKEVNDTLGHPMGDKLLCLVADRLRRHAPDRELVARFGGDEFQVLIEGKVATAGAHTTAADIIRALSEPYYVDGHTITIGASIGIAGTADVSTADELLRRADLALYRAKAEGRGVFRFFEEEMDAAMQRKREIEQFLRIALIEDHFELHYQPVIDTRTSSIVACEALVRLRHPLKGLIPPGDFITVAEETGLIVGIGRKVLNRACRDALSWPDHMRVAVNFSAKQFVLGNSLVDDIRQALAETGLAPDRLEVEITESTLVEAKESMSQLNAVAALGVRVSLDDFGTGYSSLSYLRQFPVHKIKIDRSFIVTWETRASQAIIGSISVLASLLDVEVVMEGVETLEQLTATTSLNVHIVQGFYFSRPKPLAELLPLLTAEKPFASKLDMASVA